jgi:type VI protein secretion system component VasF
MGFSQEYKDALDKLHEMMQELRTVKQSAQRQALTTKIRDQRKVVDSLRNK